MANMTLFIPDNLKKRMATHKHLRWSNIVRTVISRELDKFEETEKLAQKSRLTMRDVELLTEKVNEDTRKHIKKLMEEK